MVTVVQRVQERHLSGSHLQNPHSRELDLRRDTMHISVSRNMDITLLSRLTSPHLPRLGVRYPLVFQASL